MPAPIAVQLYSLRDDSADNFDNVLQRVAAMGYQGVEPFNLYGRSPQQFRRQVEDLGMRVAASHYPWSNRADSIQEVVDVIQALGLSRAAGGFMPEDFKDRAAVERSIETTQRLVDALKPHNLTLFLHNHFWEFEPLDGHTPYHLLQDAVPEVEFEIDTYWAANFGNNDPQQEVQRVRRRCPLLHIKDGPLVSGAANVAVGRGRMDIPAVINAADDSVLEWLIVELDKCDTSMFTAVEDSYTYLTGNNLASGRA